MRFDRIYLNRVQEQPMHHETVVVIDVLRSFTTTAVALARGARCVYPVDTVRAALALAADLPQAITVGAIGGGDPVAEFDYGNSPEAMANAPVQGRDLVLTTAAGVQGLQRFRHATSLYAASLVCGRATAEAIRRSDSTAVTFVITGEWVDRDGDEDVACADYLEALLRGDAPDPELFMQRVRDSDFGRRFASGVHRNLSPEDLRWAASCDLFDFSMPVRREHDRLVIDRRLESA